MTEATPDEPPVDAPRTGAARARTTATDHARRVLSAYTGEHGVYGVVLVTALISIGEHYDTDFEVLVYIVGTMVIFWLAHVYAGVVAANADRADPIRGIGRRIVHAARHSAGMLLAMLPPAILLALGSFGLLDEEDAYDLALLTGVVVLALIGWLNAARNGRRWYVRLLGATATALLGLLVIGLSTLAH